MSIVTVLGASGTIPVPFNSSVAATVAQTLIAKAISLGVINKTVYTPAYDSAPAIPSNFSVGEFVISSTNGGTSFSPAFGYTDIVNQSTKAVTINGGSGTVPYAVLGGTGGTSFFDSTALGGAIGIGGGADTVAANAALAPLQGNWLVDVGSGTGTTAEIVLGSGFDTVSMGGADTIIGGGGGSVSGAGGTIVLNGNTDSIDPVVVLGAGNETVSGLAGGDLLVAPGPTVTGADLIFGGTAGNDTISAPVASGINTIVGGGPGDALFAAPGDSKAIFFGGTGAETIQGGGNDSAQTIYGGTSFVNGAPNEIISGGTGNNVIVAGSGNDSIWASSGHDSIWFVASVTGANNGTPGVDILEDFNTSKDVFLYQGYGKNPFTTSTVTSGTYAGDVQFKMSDGTTVIFKNVTDSAHITTHRADAPTATP